jgi:spore coat protein CotH
MIKNKFVYSVFALLLCLFIVILFVVPNLNIDMKNTTYSYETKVFNEKKVTTVNIEVDEDEWANLKENAQDEEYIQGNVTIAGKTVNNVAIRAKGNSSLSSVVNSDSDRYSLKIDFDYYDDTQSLYGLKKLNLNNNYSDSTLMKDFVSYEMMEQMGLPTPSHSYMYVTVNGEDYGLFLGVEQVEETFLAKEFNDNSGFLYKPDGTGSDLVWISDNIDDYTGMDLKTNEKDAEDSKIIDFLKEINSENGDIESVMDVDNMLRYFAMNTALVSLDSYQGTMKHNYYLYEQDGKFSIIPWDYNMAFGGFGGGMGGGRGGNAGDAPENNTSTEGQQNAPAGQMPNMNNGTSTDESTDEEDANARGNRGGMGGGGMDMMGMGGNMMSEDNINFSITTPVSGTTLEQRPLLNALLSNDTYRAQYEAYLEDIATNIFTEENVQAITNELAAILTTYVEADPTKFSTTEQFLEGVSGDNSLAAFAKARSESILKQLSGELVVENTTSSGFPSGGQGNATEGNTNANEQDNTATNGGASPPTSNGGQGQNGQAGGFDPSSMPNGGQPPNGQPGGFDPSTMPNNGQAGGFDPSTMPNGGQAGGFDPSTMPNSGQGQNGNSSTEYSDEESNGNEQGQGNFDPSNMPNGGPPNMNGEDFDPANMPNGGPGGMPGMGPNANTDEENHFVWTKNEIILASVSGVLLLLALIFVFKFKRRR